MAIDAVRSMTTTNAGGDWSPVAGGGPMMDGEAGTRQRVAVGGGGGGSLPLSHVSRNRDEIHEMS